MRKTLQFDVCGQRVIVLHTMDSWKAYYLGDDGKRIPADITIPSHCTVSEVTQYLEDRFHESVTENHSKARKV